jgi:hypothetical protein
MGDSRKSDTDDKVLAGGAPSLPATYWDVRYFLSVRDGLPGWLPPAHEGDCAGLPNYTDQTPVIQISEVVVG